MNRKDIKVGVPYQWQSGMRKDRSGFNDHPKVIVLDTEPVYEQGWFSLSRHEMNVIEGKTAPPVWRVRSGVGRMLGAVEAHVFRPTTVNPTTGQPWTPDEVPEHLRYSCQRAEPGSFEVPVEVGTVWWPVAVQSRDIVRPWAEHEADRAKQIAASRATALVYEAQRERKRIEREAEAEIERKKAEQRAKENAVRQEFYEQRLEPPLIEAIGEAPADVNWRYGAGRVSLTFEQLERLLSAGTTQATALLEEFLTQLPTPHHERPGVIRAIEVLKHKETR